MLEIEKISVKKHVSAIHLKGEMSLLQRKLMNVFLYNAYANLLKQDEHEINITDLSYLSGFDSKNTTVLKKSATALLSTVVEWDSLKEVKGEDRSWAMSSCLSDIEYNPKTGIIKYSYSRRLREILYNPEIYAIISLSLQRKFSSKYSISLYENCLRYVNIGKTAWFEINDLKGFLGVGEDRYPDYQGFRRRVLDPAIKDINDASDIKINTVLKKSGRKVVAIQFEVARNRQESLDFDVAGESPYKSILIKKYSLSEPQALEIVSLYDEDRIERNIAYVEEQIKAGKNSINSIGAFTYKAIKGDYRPPLSDLEILQITKKEEDKKTVAVRQKQQAKEEAEREAVAQAQAEEQNARLARFWELPAERKEELSATFRGKLRSAAQKEKFDKGGIKEALKSKLAETDFKKYLETENI